MTIILRDGWYACLFGLLRCCVVGVLAWWAGPLWLTMLPV